MNLKLENKKFLITGSSSGIGLAIARSLLSEGAYVTITGRNQKKIEDSTKILAEQFESSKIFSKACDFKCTDQMIALVKELSDSWGHLDGLVANSGGSLPDTNKTIISKEIWNNYFENNFFSSVFTTQECLPLLEKSKGNILFTASIAGVERSHLSMAYSCAKASLICYTKNLAQKLASSSIRVNALAPGAVDVAKTGESYSRNIQKRSALPEEIASLATFILSDQAKYITGEIVVADGGETASF